MKFWITDLRSGRAHGSDADRTRPEGTGGTADDTLGRGMDIALTLLVFLAIGWFVDRWLGVFPLVTIVLVLFAAIGSFVRLKYVYDASMERLEAERRAARGATAAVVVEEAA